MTMNDPNAVPRVGLNGRPMPSPTAALPGTRGKVEALRGRADAGEELWHPLDARHRGSLTRQVDNLVAVIEVGTQADDVDLER